MTAIAYKAITKKEELEILELFDTHDLNEINHEALFKFKAKNLHFIDAIEKRKILELTISSIKNDIKNRLI